MAERDPYDFSALAPDFEELEELEELEDVPVLQDAGGMDEACEAEMELLANEERTLGLDQGEVDAQFQVLQRVLIELSETVADSDLDAEEAWLEGLMHEDDVDQPGTGVEPSG